MQVTKQAAKLKLVTASETFALVVSLSLALLVGDATNERRRAAARARVRGDEPAEEVARQGA